MHHLFFSLIKNDGPYRIKEKAVHVGSYATKGEAFERWQALAAKFPQAWQPDIIPGDKNPLAVLPYPQKQPVTFTAANDPALKTQFPHIDWKFEHPAAPDMDFAAWTQQVYGGWKAAYTPPPEAKQAPQSAVSPFTPQVA